MALFQSFLKKLQKTIDSQKIKVYFKVVVKIYETK